MEAALNIHSVEARHASHVRQDAQSRTIWRCETPDYGQRHGRHRRAGASQLRWRRTYYSSR
ncbi:MAG: hypothetical protein IPO07_06890 [Haliscomenobacter sp.]|nr:hypothetical protein [Haliscomenobacter sp.]